MQVTRGPHLEFVGEFAKRAAIVLLQHTQPDLVEHAITGPTWGISQTPVKGKGRGRENKSIECVACVCARGVHRRMASRRETRKRRRNSLASASYLSMGSGAPTLRNTSVPCQVEESCGRQRITQRRGSRITAEPYAYAQGRSWWRLDAMEQAAGMYACEKTGRRGSRHAYDKGAW